MAGEWIKVRTNLWDDTRVNQVVELTDTQEATVIGGLYWLWSTADEHSSDGFLPGLSVSGVDRKTGIKGFANALVTVGWLTANADGVTLARFDEHNGASAKSRAQTAKRVANHKANAMVTPGALPEPCNTVSGALPREDKIREEVKAKTPIPPPGAVDQSQKKERSAISLKTYMAECKSQNVQPIPDDDPVFDYAHDAGVSHEILALHWAEFRARYSLEGAKRYKAWRIVFGKSVRGNWFKLWYFDQAGLCTLTTAGVQAKNLADTAKRKSS